MLVCVAGLVCAGIEGGVGTAIAAQPGAGAVPGATAPAQRSADKTIEALRGAYWTAKRVGEFYTKAAAKADTENAAGAASLFRAAARVEAVHAANFSKEIEALKTTAGTAKDAAALDIKTTKDNLAAAAKLAGTARETDMPAARKTAETDGQRDAARAFRDAREGEIELVRLFKDAAELSDDWKKAKRDFYIGRTCGYIVEKLDLTKCPVCGKGRDDFEKVN
jgi:rubrerythrin